MSVDRILAQILSSEVRCSLGKDAFSLGGVAVIGSLARAAWNSCPQDGEGESLALLPAEPFVPELEAGSKFVELGLTLLRTIVGAYQAAGKLDGGELQAMVEHVALLDLSNAEKSHLIAQLYSPIDTDTLVAEATSTRVALEIYTASLLTSNVGTDAGRGYLETLVERLALPKALVRSIHRELGLPSALHDTS